jgi:hypothetical protein
LGKSNCGFSRNVVFLDYLLQLLATENLNFKLSLSQVNEPQKYRRLRSSLGTFFTLHKARTTGGNSQWRK